MSEFSENADACPDDATLTAFALGKLKGELAVVIEQHVAKCRHCALRFDEAPLSNDPLVDRLRRKRRSDDHE